MFVCCHIGSSDTLTDVSSLHDIEDGDNVDDDDNDDASLCRQVVTSDDRTTSHVTADNLSDLTIPDFAVSLPLKNHLYCVYFYFLILLVMYIINVSAMIL